VEDGILTAVRPVSSRNGSDSETVVCSYEVA
jgi:hypothetical protein